MQRGERVGLIKFGSRVDVVMPANVKVAVKVGDHVKGASSILGYAPVPSRNRHRRACQPPLRERDKWTACPRRR